MSRFGGTATTRVPFFEKIAYSGGDLAFNLVYVATGTYLMFFYTEIVGIPAAIVGTMFLVARLLDGVWDLVVGVLMEKLKSRFGKARPWILFLALPYGVSAALLFTAPDLGETGKIVYAFVTYMLSGVIVYTAMNIPYGALSALMTEDAADRGLLSTYRMVGAYAGALIVAALTLPLVETFGGGAGAWTMTFSLYGGLAVLLFFIVFVFSKERIVSADARAREEGSDTAVMIAGRPFTIREGLKSILRNKYWLQLTLYGVLLLTTYGLVGIYPYYSQYRLGDEDLSTMLFTFRTVVEIAGVFLAIPLVRLIGKRNISMFGAIAIVAGQLIIAVAPSSLSVVLIGLSIGGVGVGAMFAVLFGMIGDTIEYEEWRSGIRAEGLVFAGATIGQKIGGAVGGVAIGWTLGFGGFIEGGEATQPTSAITAISFVFIWLPLIFAIAMAGLLWFYRLDKEYPQILEDLRQRRAESAYTTTEANA
ncbi:glycoside-pentoside-hexuronide (GPH):cation symporter [Lysinibacter sp. HNR]|uniref:MFS transporter n=1 Tax=Lysinibacter sp. HNR TaxID=3031408 RepID=UPI002435A5D0|nr:glycoside-pentoside-hexuronide (GPH):cation symporter [Lysinibacter sp. HNR]WGD36911.1 glycoside-pentoside-hexuronide (GPH):cation symporter [Lysinibacter sp. HNR]